MWAQPSHPSAPAPSGKLSEQKLEEGRRSELIMLPDPTTHLGAWFLVSGKDPCVPKIVTLELSQANALTARYPDWDPAWS